jgi:tryptophan synthase alpha chain
MREIAKSASGFIYLVSSMGVTGLRSEIGSGLAKTIDALRSLTDLPLAVGFGIHTPEQAGEIAKIADGLIVGSAIVNIAGEYGEKAGPEIYRYVKKMKDAMHGI